MERISKNFTREEFEFSQTAKKRGLDNTIPEDIKPSVYSLVLKLLQPLCDYMGAHDSISSGYRCDELNNLVGGVLNSQHTKGEASDNKFYVNTINSRRLLNSYEVLEKLIESGLEFDQCILYDSFVHLSYTTKRENRNQVLYNKSYTGKRL